jgi:hypothetical protein
MNIIRKIKRKIKFLLYQNTVKQGIRYMLMWGDAYGGPGRIYAIRYAREVLGLTLREANFWVERIRAERVPEFPPVKSTIEKPRAERFSIDF